MATLPQIREDGKIKPSFLGLPNPQETLEEVKSFMRGVLLALSLVFLLLLALGAYVVIRRV